MPPKAYSLTRPSRLTSAVVFASPHSGREYPDTFLQNSVLDRHVIRSSEDAFVDQLFDCVPEFGAPLLSATAPRAFVDMNRSCDELDPALIYGVKALGSNPRVASGLGVVPRVVANGRSIYRGKISRDEADARIADHWLPYHTQLQSLLDEAHTEFGESILVDCHSMPHEALDSIAKSGARRPDVVLGDRFGAAAHDEIVDRIESAFAGAGLHVIRNVPFAGAYITQHYGRPSRQRHAIQVEIDRSIYMDEARIVPNANFGAFRNLLRGVVSEIAAISDRAQPMAAE